MSIYDRPGVTKVAEMKLSELPDDVRVAVETVQKLGAFAIIAELDEDAGTIWFAAAPDEGEDE